MNDIENIKNELISLYNLVKTDFSPEFNNTDVLTNTFSILSLINNIKQLIINNENNYSNKKLLKDYHQLENHLRKIEFDNRHLISEIMNLQIMKASLEIKLNTYSFIENELDELKTKVKFEEGKFLENDRKDNEILILRKENSSLKKELSFLEFKNKKYEQKKIQYKEKIKSLEDIIKNLNKKINLIQIKINNNENKSRNFIINNNIINRTMLSSSSKIDLKTKTSNTTVNLFNKLDNQNYSTIKNIRNNSIKDSDIKNISKIYSPNNERFLFENHKNKSTISRNNKAFDMTFNSIINKFNNKKIKIPFKKEFTDLIKKKKNKSVKRRLNYDIDENKNLLNKSNKTSKNNIINSNNSGNRRNFFVKIIKKEE